MHEKVNNAITQFVSIVNIFTKMEIVNSMLSRHDRLFTRLTGNTLVCDHIFELATELRNVPCYVYFPIELVAVA